MISSILRFDVTEDYSEEEDIPQRHSSHGTHDQRGSTSESEDGTFKFLSDMFVFLA